MKNLKSFMEAAETSLDKEEKMKQQYARDSEASHAAAAQRADDEDRESRITAKVEDQVRKQVSRRLARVRRADAE